MPARLRWASWLCCQRQRGHAGRGRSASQPVCAPAARFSLERVPGSQTDKVEPQSAADLLEGLWGKSLAPLCPLCYVKLYPGLGDDGKYYL